MTLPQAVHILDISARLNELRTLKDGWLEGKGSAPAGEGLDWLTGAFQEHFPQNSVRPYLYPTAEGGVQAEWSLEPWEASLEIDLTSHRGQWHLLNLRTDQEQHREINLNCDEDWSWLIAQIEHAGAPHD